MIITGWDPHLLENTTFTWHHPFKKFFEMELLCISFGEGQGELGYPAQAQHIESCWCLITQPGTQRHGLVSVGKRLVRVEQTIQLLAGFVPAASLVQGNDHVVTDVRDIWRH